MATRIEHVSPFPAASARSLLRTVGEYLFRMVRDYRARRALHSMSDAMLQDIGLRRTDLGQLSTERWWQPIDWGGLDTLRRGCSR